MTDALKRYLSDLKVRSQRNSNEHAYRKSLEIIFPNLDFTQEPKGHGRNKVDIEVYTKDGLISFYIETKNLGVNLSDASLQSQFSRYKNQFKKLIITNFLDFEFYRDGNLVQSCCLGSLSGVENSADFEKFKMTLDSFLLDCIEFTDAQKLAKKLAEKTKPLKQAILTKLNQDDIEIKEQKNTPGTTRKQYKLIAYRAEFQKIIDDINNDDFSDLYAQTIAYGLFASRYYSSKNNASTFSRQEAAGFIPQTNPLLKEFFKSISQDYHDLPSEINLLIDSILAILANSNMQEVVSSLGNRDIVIHFYETFLDEYDPKKKKDMGVWYTPSEVVDYMVKSVDYILKTKFGIRDGISSSEKQNFRYTRKKSNQIQEDISETTHKVQILDPATGTGTFLNSVASYIKAQYRFPSLWNDYALKELIPRLHGFELMMPSYVMAHMKMAETLNLAASTTPRFNIFLTNTLNDDSQVEHNLFTLSDFVYALNEESLGANRVRHEKPIFVIIGNPPYNGNSKNNGDLITNLMGAYKSEKNIGKALNDDYIKFIRYGQSLIDKNQSGIIAYISNNSYIQSIACSKMRESLLKSFDEIYILNLHGDKDENVFSITTAVCVSFFVKTNQKEIGTLGKVYYHEIKGLKSDKFSYCTNNILNFDFKEIPIIGDEKYFIPQDVDAINQYNLNSFSLDELFLTKGQAILTACDDLVTDTDRNKLLAKITDFQTKGWLPEKIENGVESTRTGKIRLRALKNKNGIVKPFPYRPFDTRFIYDSDMVLYRKTKLTQHDQVESNIYINFKHNCWDKNNFTHICITNHTPSNEFFAHGATYTAPLYQYNVSDPNDKPLPTQEKPKFSSNLKNAIKSKFTSLDLDITDLDIIDYIYGLLNDKDYTTKYNQFLKSNYARVPYPESLARFHAYKDKGSKLRLLHLDDETQDEQSSYNATDNNAIEKIIFDGDKVYFNETSFFDQISQDMWDFKIGASQPLKNWLESRENNTFDQKMVEIYLNIIFKVRNTLKIKSQS